MGANETRLLVLGALSIVQPANGYQVRRALIAWGTDRWAHVQPGSIYSSLSTMAKHGVIEEAPAPEHGRGVVAYRLTAAGRGELDRLFEVALTSVEPMRPLAFFTAINLASLLPRARYLELLRRRLAVHEVWAATVQPFRSEDLPDYVHRSINYWDGAIANEMRWLRETIEQVEAGELLFAGEGEPWAPDPSLPSDPTRYRRMLALDGEVAPE